MSRKTWIALGVVMALIAGGAWYFLGTFERQRASGAIAERQRHDHRTRT